MLVLANLKPRALVGFKSHGMVLCASNAEHTEVKFVDVPASANVGDRVVFKGEGVEVVPPAEVGRWTRWIDCLRSYVRPLLVLAVLRMVLSGGTG